jgi:hypothetical protein
MAAASAINIKDAGTGYAKVCNIELSILSINHARKATTEKASCPAAANTV